MSTASGDSSVPGAGAATFCICNIFGYMKADTDLVELWLYWNSGVILSWSLGLIDCIWVQLITIIGV